MPDTIPPEELQRQTDRRMRELVIMRLLHEVGKDGQVSEVERSIARTLFPPDGSGLLDFEQEIIQSATQAYRVLRSGEAMQDAMRDGQPGNEGYHRFMHLAIATIGKDDKPRGKSVILTAQTQEEWKQAQDYILRQQEELKAKRRLSGAEKAVMRRLLGTFGLSYNITRHGDEQLEALVTFYERGSYNERKFSKPAMVLNGIPSMVYAESLVGDVDRQAHPLLEDALRMHLMQTFSNVTKENADGIVTKMRAAKEERSKAYLKGFEYLLSNPAAELDFAAAPLAVKRFCRAVPAIEAGIASGSLPDDAKSMLGVVFRLWVGLDDATIARINAYGSLSCLVKHPAVQKFREYLL